MIWSIRPLTPQTSVNNDILYVSLIWSLHLLLLLFLCFSLYSFNCWCCCCYCCCCQDCCQDFFQESCQDLYCQDLCKEYSQDSWQDCWQDVVMIIVKIVEIASPSPPIVSKKSRQRKRQTHWEQFRTRCQIWCTIEFHRDPISKVLSEW